MLHNMKEEYTEDQFPELYDLEEAYDTLIHPMVVTIMNICNEYGIPMIASFQYKNEKSQLMLSTTAVLPVHRTGERITNAAEALGLNEQ